MSLFNEFQVSANCFLPDDNNTTKKVTWDYDTVDFTIDINIITLSPEEEIIYQQEFASDKANIDSTSASSLIKGARIAVGTKKYEVTNTPLLRKLFPGTYTCRLRRIND